jgi:hypothetical protein
MCWASSRPTPPASAKARSPAELFDEVGKHLATVGREVGVNTGRARRCGWFDAVLVRQSVAINGIDGIALTKLDVLDGLKTLKICVGYKIGGQGLDYLPAGLRDQAAATPVYEELEGWSESTAGAQLQGSERQRCQIRAPDRGADRRAGGPAVDQPRAGRHHPDARPLLGVGRGQAKTRPFNAVLTGSG